MSRYLSRPRSAGKHQMAVLGRQAASENWGVDPSGLYVVETDPVQLRRAKRRDRLFVAMTAIRVLLYGIAIAGIVSLAPMVADGLGMAFAGEYDTRGGVDTLVWLVYGVIVVVALMSAAIELAGVFSRVPEALMQDEVLVANRERIAVYACNDHGEIIRSRQISMSAVTAPDLNVSRQVLSFKGASGSDVLVFEKCDVGQAQGLISSLFAEEETGDLERFHKEAQEPVAVESADSEKVSNSESLEDHIRLVEEDRADFLGRREDQ